MPANTLPNIDAIKELLGGLLGDGTVVRPGPAARKAEPAVVADYVNDEGVAQARLICDLSLANSAGAALTMIPPPVAQEAIKKQEVPETILVNLQEILNICVNVFAGNEQQHLKLGRAQFVRPGQPGFPAAAVPSSAAFEVQVPRYGQGTLVAELL